MLQIKSSKHRLAPHQLLGLGSLLIALGIAATRVSRALPSDFLSGFLLGVGIAVLLAGVTIGTTAGRRARR